MLSQNLTEFIDLTLDHGFQFNWSAIVVTSFTIMLMLYTLYISLSLPPAHSNS